MQITSRDELMMDWLRTVRMVEMPAIRWALAGFAGAGEPVSLRKAQQWVARCREAGLVDTARPSYQSASIVWATHAVTGRSAPNLVRQTVRHDLAVAAVSARYILAGWEWDRDRDPAEGEVRADGSATRGDRRELIEVELTAKAKDRYPKIFLSQSERLRFDGITDIVYITDVRTTRAIVAQIKDRVYGDDQAHYTVIPALDMWGRVDEGKWPASERFSRPFEP